MLDPLAILTVQDMAAYLQTSEEAVFELIESGEIPSFNIGSEPRVQAGALITWFQSEMRTQELEALKRSLENKQTWSVALQEDPELRQQIENTTYEEGTFGALLKSALSEPPRKRPSNTPKQFRSSVSVPSFHLADSQPQTTDYLARLRSRPVIAFMVAVAITVIGIGAFTEALTKVSAFFSSILGWFQ